MTSFLSSKQNLLDVFNNDCLFLYEGSLFKASPFLISILDIMNTHYYLLDNDGAPFLLEGHLRDKFRTLAANTFYDASKKYLTEINSVKEFLLSKKVKEADIEE